MTRAREAALAILRSARVPLTAAEIFRSTGSEFDQATVYRTLHWLEDSGLADSFVLHCDSHGTERYYTASTDEKGKANPHRHWFHCERCHEFTDLGSCKLRSLVSSYESELGLEVRSHTLYFTGICAACRR
ncbi:MAG TPA: transcriptional repressor [Treponemataceae bacterium]|nr:transcriptional repressor [Treponemataceae bacterium]HPS43451.1 transcriptional repressor [Treponemataceae bacterium]